MHVCASVFVLVVFAFWLSYVKPVCDCKYGAARGKQAGVKIERQNFIAENAVWLLLYKSNIQYTVFCLVLKHQSVHALLTTQNISNMAAVRYSSIFFCDVLFTLTKDSCIFFGLRLSRNSSFL